MPKDDQHAYHRFHCAHQHKKRRPNLTLINSIKAAVSINLERCVHAHDRHLIGCISQLDR
jgi:hypothetical protein